VGRRGARAAVDLDGFVVLDKPAGMTSHDVVARCRRVLDQPRAGHAGTLDPDATGVLVVGLGSATRLMRFATGLEKSYVGELVLGTATSTLDSSGEVVATYDMSGVTLEQVRAAAAELTGPIRQIPPMVSAVRVGGRRLHEIARAGGVVERESRAVEVARFDVEATTRGDVFTIAVDCSSGTYVRALAADVGAALGGGAHLRALRRTAIGMFAVETAVPLEALGQADVRPSRELVAHLATVATPPAIAEQVVHGRVLDRRELGVLGAGPWAVTGADGVLLAVYEAWREDKAKPTVVVARPAARADQADESVREPAGGGAERD